MDKASSTRTLTVSVGLAPWFTTRCQQLKEASQQAIDAGVPPDIVYESTRAAVLAVLPDAVQVNVGKALLPVDEVLDATRGSTG